MSVDGVARCPYRHHFQGDLVHDPAASDFAPCACRLCFPFSPDRRASTAERRRPNARFRCCARRLESNHASRPSAGTGACADGRWSCIINVSARKIFWAKNNRLEPLSEVRRDAIFLSVSFKKIWNSESSPRSTTPDCCSSARELVTQSSQKHTAGQSVISELVLIV